MRAQDALGLIVLDAALPHHPQLLLLFLFVPVSQLLMVAGDRIVVRALAKLDVTLVAVGELLPELLILPVVGGRVRTRAVTGQPPGVPRWRVENEAPDRRNLRPIPIPMHNDPAREHDLALYG